MADTTGKIVKLTREKGWGFIKATDGIEYFFHRTGAPDYDGLHEGDTVTFQPTTAPKGPRAESVQLA